MRIVATLLVLSGIALVGCDRRSADKKPIEVNAPGVNVKVDPKEGVKVRAPGVDVETK